MEKYLGFLVLLAVSAPAWADKYSYGLYGGGGVGVAAYSGAPVGPPGSTSSSFGSKTGETVFLGFLTSKQIAFETSLFYFGEVTSKVSQPGFNQQVSIGVYGATEDLVGYYRVSDRLSAFGRAGVSAVWTQGNPTVQGGLKGDFGVGLELATSEDWSLRVGYTHYHHLGSSYGGVDTSNVSVNLADVSVVYWF